MINALGRKSLCFENTLSAERAMPLFPKYELCLLLLFVFFFAIQALKTYLLYASDRAQDAQDAGVRGLNPTQEKILSDSSVFTQHEMGSQCSSDLVKVKMARQVMTTYLTMSFDYYYQTLTTPDSLMTRFGLRAKYFLELLQVLKKYASITPQCHVKIIKRLYHKIKKRDSIQPLRAESSNFQMSSSFSF